MNETVNNEVPLKIRLKQLLIDILGWCFIISAVSSGSLYIIFKITGIQLLKQIASFALLPLLTAILAYFSVFFGGFVVYCFLCLIPWRKKDPQILIFGEDDSLSWWGALIWLIIILGFFSQVIPNIIDWVKTVFEF